MSVSTASRKSLMPCSACKPLCRPSKVNGFVTTPTVRAPSSFASRAITGPPPVPVPPPMPAVMKTISAPESVSASARWSSSAALRPTSGLAPAPRPFVSSLPSCTLWPARFARSACISVLAAMKSTPSRPGSIIVLIALPPPPPTPTTLILAFCEKLSTSSNMVNPLVCSNMF